ncbi:MAG: hypothetical protein ABSC20_06705 [Candidatus Bathyarchaeia archaeon]|jgi:hypothetical protein
MSNTSVTKSKLNKKLVAILIIVIIAVAAVAVWQLYPKKSTTSKLVLPPMTLTVIGANGQTVVLNSTSMAALSSYTAKGGFESSGGAIEEVGNYTGVPIQTILNLVGGITSDETLTATGSDGYSMVFTYAQVNGQGFTTYDPVTGSEVQSNQTLTMVISYFQNGAPIASDIAPLRLCILGSEGLLTEGHYWVSLLDKLQVTGNVQDWNVTVNATTSLVMDRQAFTADLNHFPLNWTDANGNVWTGDALWRWVSWSNVNGGVSNASLNAGYSVKVIGGDGYSATFEGSQVNNNNNIIVAAELNGAILSAPYWPLTIVGSDVTTQEMVKNIVQIDIILNSPSPTSTATPQDYSLIVNGTNAVTMSRATFESQVSASSVSYTASGTTWTGTPLHRLVVWAQSNGVIDSSLLASGYVVEVIGSDGYTSYLNDSSVNMNTHIMVANQANGAALSGSNWPLTLTGSDLTTQQMVQGITQIKIIPLQDLNLTIIGPTGTQVVLHSNDLLALSSYTANGGTRSNGGTLANFGSYTGVPILTLCNLVGGLTSSNTITVTGSDGYQSTYSYAQANGQGILMYNSAGTQVSATQPLTMIVAYFLNGANIPSGTGPLRAMVVGPDGLYMTGSYSAQLVVKIQINS